MANRRVDGSGSWPEWLTTTTYAHRGLHSAGVPENSLAAAEAAISRGLGIECDIQRSADGVAMVFHDWELERLTGHMGLVSESDARDLEALSLLDTDQSPVTLDRLLDAIGGQVPLLIEIKSQPGYDVEWTCLYVARLLTDYGGPAAVMSFDPRVSKWFAKNAPDICRGLVGTDSLRNGFEGVWRSSDDIEQARPEFLAIDRRDLALAEAAAWRASGKPLLSWTIRTAQDRETAATMADALIAEGEALA
ncbi:MAG: glycerophosphodiester phosphodiesterase family protein [Erythrobacter sp.]